MKLLSKALTGLWTTDRVATNQMTIPFDKLPCKYLIQQSTLAKLPMPELSKALLLNNVDQVEEKKKNEDLNSNTSFTEFNTSISH